MNMSAGLPVSARNNPGPPPSLPRMRRPDKHIGTVIGGYVLEEMIGWGSGTKVYRARHHLTGHLQAIKLISKSHSKVGTLHQSFPECSIMGRLKHPNIVELTQWFETEKRVYLIMELARDGDLLTVLNNAPRPPSEETVQRWFVQIIDALAFAHARGYVHGDLRLENIFLDGNRILIGDWGSASTYYAGVPCGSFNPRTASYSPPEVLARRPYFPPQAECWALGVMLYALACGRLPFDRHSPNFAQDVASGNFAMPVHISIRLRSMIHGLLCVDPVIRFSMFDIQHHDFFTSAKPEALAHPPSSPVTRAAAAASSSGNDGSSQPSTVLPAASPLAMPASRSGSAIGSELARRRKPSAVVTLTRVHELRDSPPRSASFGSLIRLAREPPSPCPSEASSRVSSKRSSRSFDTDGEDKDGTGAEEHKAERNSGGEEKSKEKKPFKRVLAFIKHLPGKVLGGHASSPS